MKAYKEKQVKNNVVEREFSASNSQEFVWHRDKEDRKLVVIQADKGWKFQEDNCLPIDLFEGKVIFIPKEVFHRVVAGSGKLKVKIFLHAKIEKESR